MDEDDLAGGPASLEQDDFAAAFAQRAEERRSGKPATSANEDDANQAEAAGTSDDGNAAADAAAKQPAEQDPKGSDARQDQQGAGKTARELELESELAAALHRERSVANRISANDRRANELVAENDRLKREIAGLKQQPTKQQPTKTTEGKALSDALADVPELEAAVNRRIEEGTAALQQALDAANAKLQQLGESTEQTARAVRPVVERDAEAAIRQVWTELDGMFTPQWREDRRGIDFQRWLNNQSRTVQELYANSVDAKDCALVLDQFYNTRGGRPKPVEQSTGGGQRAGANTQSAQHSAADRLKQAAGIQARTGAVAVKPDPNDFDAAFAEAAAAKRNRKD